ncbi:MAG: transcriptional repressor LexA [Elusimicrobia bacterium]|nr:transcriptional repressor LexA [Elusimicrobiota bacterium]
MEPTQKQRQVLDFISRFIQKTGASPTFREIGTHFGFASLRAVAGHIDALVKKGLLKKEKRKFRSLMPTTGTFRPDWSALTPVPECLATVPLGSPKALSDEMDEVHWISKSLTGAGEFCMFPVKGDSMVKAGIFSGDYVIAKQQTSADVGDIVVAIYQGGATLKKYGRDSKGNHLLIPENDSMAPIIIAPDDSDFRIVGKMTLLIRKAKNLRRA